MRDTAGILAVSKYVDVLVGVPPIYIYFSYIEVVVVVGGIYWLCTLCSGTLINRYPTDVLQTLKFFRGADTLFLDMVSVFRRRA